MHSNIQLSIPPPPQHTHASSAALSALHSSNVPRATTSNTQNRKKTATEFNLLQHTHHHTPLSIHHPVQQASRTLTHAPPHLTLATPSPSLTTHHHTACHTTTSSSKLTAHLLPQASQLSSIPPADTDSQNAISHTHTPSYTHSHS